MQKWFIVLWSNFKSWLRLPCVNIDYTLWIQLDTYIFNAKINDFTCLRYIWGFVLCGGKLLRHSMYGPGARYNGPGCFGAKLRLKSDFSPGSLHGCWGPVSVTIHNKAPINIKYRPPGTRWSYWYWCYDPSRAKVELSMGLSLWLAKILKASCQL